MPVWEWVEVRPSQSVPCMSPCVFISCICFNDVSHASVCPLLSNYLLPPLRSSRAICTAPVSVRWWTHVGVMNSRMYTRKQLDVNLRSSSLIVLQQKVLCKMALVDLQWPSNVFTCIMNRNGSIMQELESLRKAWCPCDTLKDLPKSFATAKDFDFATVSFDKLFELLSPDHSCLSGFYWKQKDIKWMRTPFSLLEHCLILKLSFLLLPHLWIL